MEESARDRPLVLVSSAEEKKFLPSCKYFSSTPSEGTSKSCYSRWSLSPCENPLECVYLTQNLCAPYRGPIKASITDVAVTLQKEQNSRLLILSKANGKLFLATALGRLLGSRHSGFLPYCELSEAGAQNVDGEENFLREREEAPTPRSRIRCTHHHSDTGGRRKFHHFCYTVICHLPLTPPILDKNFFHVNVGSQKDGKSIVNSYFLFFFFSGEIFSYLERA